MNIKPYCQRRKYSLVTLVSGIIGLCGYSEGLPGEGRQTTVGYSKTSIFSAFGRYTFGTLGNKANGVI